MNPLHDLIRRRRDPRVGVETLEARELLTGGAGNTFAIVPGTISKAGAVDTIPFTIDSGHFTFPHGKALLGIDVAVATNSTVKPVIVSITGPNGQPLHLSRGHYNPKTQRNVVANGLTTSAVLATYSLGTQVPSQPQTYHVTIKGQANTTGGFVLGFYLPGDVTGTGTVTTSDLTATTAALKTTPTSTNYNFEADANRDGLINAQDIRIVKQNMGVSTTVSPVLSANLDPASTTGDGSRVTNDSSVHFTGAATPGASITFTDSITNSTPVTTTADAQGNYSITVPVGLGSNTFQITTLDAFGQSISGSIDPVTYVANTSTPTPTGTLTPTTTSTPTTSTPATTSTTPTPSTTSSSSTDSSGTSSQGSTTPSSSPTTPTVTTTVTTPTAVTTTTTPVTASSTTTTTPSGPTTTTTTTTTPTTDTTTPTTDTTTTPTTTTDTTTTDTTTPTTDTTTTPTTTTSTTPTPTTPTTTTSTPPPTTPIVVPPKPNFPFAKNSKIWKAYLTAVAASTAQAEAAAGTTSTS